MCCESTSPLCLCRPWPGWPGGVGAAGPGAFPAASPPSPAAGGATLTSPPSPSPASTASRLSRSPSPLSRPVTSRHTTLQRTRLRHISIHGVSESWGCTDAAAGVRARVLPGCAVGRCGWSALHSGRGSRVGLWPRFPGAVSGQLGAALARRHGD